MKRVLMILACFLYSWSYAQTQDGFSFLPQLGSNNANSIFQPYTPATNYQIGNTKMVFSLQCQVDVDYTRGNWQVVSGIGYLYPSVNNGFSIQKFIEKNKQFDPHIVVPVKLGYTINTPNHQFSVLPELGFQGDYNNHHTLFQDNSDNDGSAKISQKENNGFIFSGVAQCNFQYMFHDRYIFTCGPMLQYTVTSILMNGQPCNCTMFFNTGVKYKIAHKKHRKKLSKSS